MDLRKTAHYHHTRSGLEQTINVSILVEETSKTLLWAESMTLIALNQEGTHVLIKKVKKTE